MRASSARMTMEEPGNALRSPASIARVARAHEVGGARQCLEKPRVHYARRARMTMEG
jgi:hypothetical protein